MHNYHFTRTEQGREGFGCVWERAPMRGHYSELCLELWPDVENIGLFLILTFSRLLRVLGPKSRNDRGLLNIYQLKEVAVHGCDVRVVSRCAGFISPLSTVHL